MSAGEILQQWLAAVNGHDVGALTSLMAKDFVFVDSLGNRVSGDDGRLAGLLRDVPGLLG